MGTFNKLGRTARNASKNHDGWVIGLVVLGVILLILAAIAFNVGYVVLIGFMFYWNITDIQNVGPNGWNIAWLGLATVLALGYLGSVFKSRVTTTKRD